MVMVVNGRDYYWRILDTSLSTPSATLRRGSATSTEPGLGLVLGFKGGSLSTQLNTEIYLYAYIYTYIYIFTYRYAGIDVDMDVEIDV